MHQTIVRRERLRLEQIGHLQGRFDGTEQHSWPDVGETMDVTSHMRLIGVAGTHGEIRQALLGARLARSLEKTLETQHRLKHLWTVANGSRKSPMKLTFAYPDPVAQLLDTAMRMAREPLDTGQDSLVDGSGMFN
jgi:hypothetical protein